MKRYQAQNSGRRVLALRTVDFFELFYRVGLYDIQNRDDLFVRKGEDYGGMRDEEAGAAHFH